jgi:hypothetical protein
MHVNTEDMMGFAADILSNGVKFVVINFGTTALTLCELTSQSCICKWRGCFF